MSLVGTNVGGIRVLASLGEGGMGEVYVGLDEKLERRVALKAIRAERRPSASARARFVREARILSSLDHPHICRIHGYLEGEEADFLVLELLEGQRLDAALAKGLDRSTRLRVAEEIVRALAAAHERGIVHRDLKPQNVMLTPSGGVKVLDFGIAAPVRVRSPADGPPTKASPGPLEDATDSSSPTMLSPGADDDELVTRAGTLVGTLAYMSPEQARGEELTTASDMYAFGLVVLELFTGRPPFPPGLGAQELLERAQRGATAPRDGVERGVAALLDRLLAAAPAARPTAVDTLAAVRRLRDAPRRRRRLVAAAAVAIGLSVAVVKYVVDLRAARGEAERRRTQAEDLISFMLGDLRTKLESVGRLEILDDVGAKAMAYFAAVPEASLSDEELLRRSKALYQIGTVRIARGQLEAATGPLEESLALAKALHQREPDDATRRFELGQAQFYMGYAQWRRRDLDAALVHFRAYVELAEQLVRSDPENPAWQTELSSANSNIASVVEEQGDLDGALERYQASLAADERLAAVRPGDATLKRSLAASHNTVGAALRALGRLEESLEHHRTELRLQEELVREHPGTAEWRRYLGVSREYVAGILEAQGHVAPALELNAAALDVFAALAAGDPANAAWQRELGQGHYRVASSLSAAGRGRQALDHGRRSVAILASTAAKAPADVAWQKDLANARNGLGLLLLDSGDLDGTTREAELARDAADRVLARDPDDPLARRIRSESLTLLARAWEARGETTRAAEAWSGAVAEIEPIARGSSDYQLLVPWATALLGARRHDEARAVANRLAEMGYRHPRLVRTAAGHGVRWPDRRSGGP